MPEIVKNNIDELNAELTITISKLDYEPKLEEELRKYRKKAQIKGFRKGKTPIGFIKKAYGQSILGDVVNGILQDKMSQYLNDEGINFLGQPLPSPKQEEINLEIKSLNDYIFKFDVGLAPQFELKNLTAESSFDYYKIQASEEMITEDLDKARTRLGKQELIESAIEEGDIIRISAKEHDGNEYVEEGHETEFSVAVRDLDPKYAKQVLGKTKGLNFQFDIFELEKDRDEEHVIKYLYGAKEGVPVRKDIVFEGTVTEVNRINLAPLNENFFTQFFGEGKVTNEEEARDVIRKDIEKYFERESDALLFMELQNRLLAEHEMNLPDEFLKRWLQSASENNSEEVIEEGYSNFARGLKWTLIRSKIAKAEGLQVQDEDINNYFAVRARSYLGAYADENYVNTTVQKLRQNKEQVEKAAEDILSQKLFDKFKGIVTLNEKKVSMEEFKEIAAEIQKV